MAKKPRKPHTSRKRIITPETRTKIARALAAKLGPTSDWDKPEPTGRKTNGIDKTTGHKITISTPKRTLTKPKTPPNPNTIHNPNGTKAGGHRASTHYLNTQKITQEPLAQERLTERANTLTTPQKVTKYLDKLDQRLKTANTDTGNPETNRQNQRLALKHLVEAQLLGLVNPNGEQINDTPTWKPETAIKQNTTTKTPKQPWHPKTHGTYTPQQQEQEHKNPAAPGGIIHTEAKNLTPLQLKRLANHYGLTDENIINQLGVQAGNPKFRKTQAFNTTYDKWLLDKLGAKLGVTNRQELDTKLTELNGGKDPHKTMVSPIMFQTATPELRQLIEQELGYLPSRRNMERDKAGQPKPHPRAGLKISQKRTKQETDARDLAALKADQQTIRKQETQAKKDTEKQRIINRRATHQRDEYQANQDDTAPKPETKPTIPVPKRGERIMRKHTTDGETFNRDGIIRNGIKIKKSFNGYALEVPGRDKPVDLTYDYRNNTGPEDLNDARAAVDRITEDMKLPGVDPNNYWLGRTEKEISKTVDDPRIRPYIESNKLYDAETLRAAREQATTGKQPSASKQPTYPIRQQADQKSVAKTLRAVHRMQNLRTMPIGEERNKARKQFNETHPVENYEELAAKIIEHDAKEYRKGNKSQLTISPSSIPRRPTDKLWLNAIEQHGGFPNADLKKKLRDLESNTATRHIRRGEAGVKAREARKKLRELTSTNPESESTEEVRKLKLEQAQHEAKLRKQLETFWKEQKRTLKMEGATDKDLEYVNGKIESATRVSKQAEKNLAKYSEPPKPKTTAPTQKEPPRTNWKTNLTTNDPNTPLENQAHNLSDNDLITAYKGLKADTKYWEHHIKTRSTYTQQEAITNRDKTLTQQINIGDELKQRGFKLNALNKGRQNGTTEAQMNAQREQKAHQAKLHNANVVNSIAISRPEALTKLNDTELTDWYNTINTLEKNYKPEDWAKVQKALPTIHEEINRRGLGNTEQINRKAQKAMSFDDDLIAAAKDPHADYIRENDILVPHKNYKVTTYKGDGAGKDNNYITNPSELISIALANTHNTKETNNLLKFRDRIDAGAPLWTDKNGTLHTTSKIDANTRITLETILETTGTTTDAPSWNDGIPQGRIHHDDLKARGWTSDMIWENLEDVMKLKDVPDGTNKRTYSMREVEAVEATNKKIAKAVGDRAHLIPLAETPATSENTWGRTALKERGWTERMIERYLGEPDFYDRGYDNRPFYKWHKDRIKQAEAEDPALRRRIEQDEKKRQEKFDKLTEGGKGYFRRINGDWVIAGKDIKRGQTIIVRKKNGEEKKVYIGSVTTVDDTTYGVPGTPPVTLNQQAREIGKELPQPMSNKAKEHKVNTSPVTSKQISFINKLLARHSRNYGVIEGENLFLDSFTYKYPTQTELKKMTRSEASFLIDILQNDEM
ncbi:hypothetical protein I4J10_10360 [Corynebacterium diphtheriae bv. mitis]|uniref:hypothetical protein n=1 Tax=Corynebacterium diphtheriae TaxID=1717 RepID=UPI0013CAE4BE|nr:hypothetical protein [Corynebacterium diphtheriae]MBG9277561.1 hypothetical protein [Corynebacterium diphtheriae bv. mitis]MBG9282056.1 hypothetical protein [Corynebacterium diphtheriae bv. mitis]CAB0903418.1 hypothetical protein FRC0425_01136 [Corynebacterium diphtheriae]